MNSRTSSFFIMATATILFLFSTLPVFSAPQQPTDFNTIADQSLHEHNPTLPATDRVIGPDAFGYVCIDNAEPNGPRYSWIAHTDSAITVPATAWTNGTDNGYAGPYTIPFSFPFYGTQYTQLYLGTNGYITLGTNGYTGSAYPNLPLTYFPYPVIFFWSRDMHVGYGGTVVRYQSFSNPSRFVITFDSLSAYNSTTPGANRVSSQVILYPDGTIIMQYRNMLGQIGTSYPGIGGIQTAQGTNYLQYSPPVPAETTAVKFFMPCYLVSNPNPPDMSFQVPVTTRLVWNRGTCTANLFDVYLSTDSNSVRSMAGFTRVATRITDTTFTPTTNLSNSTYYYWRIFCRSATGDSIPGPMWSFRTFQNSLIAGTRTIGGTNPDFSSIHDAITALNALGAGTGVTFLIRGGTYNEAPDTIGVMAMTGPNSRVVFRAADTNAVIINKMCTSAQPYAFKLQNAKYITFDGSPASDPTRRVITINATDATYGYHTFWLTNGSNYNTLKNLNMTVACPNTNGSSEPVYAYFTTGQYPNVPPSSDTIINCRIAGGYAGVYLYSSSGGTLLSNWTVANNKIVDFGYNGGISLYGCSNSLFNNNEITLTTPASSSLSQLPGIYSSVSFNTNNVFNGNWIYGLNASSSNTQVYGMYMYYGPNKLISNNMINLDPTTASTIFGIYLGQDRTDVLYNTVRIGGTGSSNSSYGIYFNSQTQDTLANNILINERIASGGMNVCFYSPWGVNTPPWAYSDYNLMTTVDTSTTDNRYTAYMGGYYNTLNNLRANTNYLWDTHSRLIPPQFMGVPNLHIDPIPPTAVESAGRPFVRVPADIDGDTRNATTPDIGADEGNFVTGTDLYPPRIAMTPLGLWNTTPRTFSANIFDNVSVALDTLRAPRVYYKLSTDANWNFRRADSTSDSIFWFSIPGYPMGSIVNYYIAAQDTSRNVITYPYGGRGSNPPGTTPPVNYAVYYINTLITGVKTIGGTNPDYPSLNAAITALNNIGVGTGGVIYQIRNGNYTEPSSTINVSLDATRPVLFKVDSGATATFTLTPQAGNSAGIQLKSRYVTFDGSWPRDSVGKHLAITGTALSSAVWFSDSSAYDVIKNCVLDIGIQNGSGARTVMFGNSSNFPPITGNILQYCNINGGYYGIYHYAAGGTQRIDSTLIQYCNIKNFYYYGLYMYYGNGITVSRNSFYDTTAMTSGGTYVIYIGGNVNGSLFDGNRISSLLNQSYASFYGFYNVNGPNVYSNNMIDLGNGPYGSMYGFYSSGNGGKFLFNSVNIRGTTTSTYYSYAFFNGNNGGTPDTLWGNIFQNTRTGPTTGGNTYHVALGLQSATTVGFSNYNLLSVGSDSVGDNRFVAHIGAQTGGTNYNTFTDLINSPWAPRDMNSYPDIAPFVNDSNLHIQSNVVTPIESGAPRHWQVPYDYDGQTRNAMADIGADEGTFRAAIYGTIRGIVRDSSATRPPMPGVVITAGRFIDTTDADGAYSMIVRTGLYNVYALTACYDTMWAMNVQVDSARTDTVNFFMLHPELSSDHTSLELVGSPGQTRLTSFTLTNTGNGNLHWQAVALTDPHQDAIGGGNERPPVSIRLIANTDKSGAGQLSDIAPPTHGSTSATDQMWGPDGYGYRAMDNQELTFPNYVQFTDIRGVGTPIAGLINTTSDQYVFARLAPMRFSYYGTVYDSIVVCNDGYVQFNNTGYAYGYNYAMPQTSFPNGVFVLHHYFNGTVYKYYDSTAHIFYVQWAGVNRYATNDSLVFQLQLHSRINAMVFAYSNVTITNLYATIGIQNVQGANNRYIQCFFSQSSPFSRTLNGYMIAFNDMSTGGGGAWPSWLNVTPSVGMTLPRQNSTITVTAIIDTGVTVPAVWTGNIRISSDACPNVVMIPVSLSVTRNAAPEATEIPIQYKLYQNYPNPFNPTTEIRFDLKQSGMTRLTIYNALGRQVLELVNSQLPAGFHSVRFDGSKLATGVYFYRIQSGKFNDVKKMVMMK